MTFPPWFKEPYWQGWMRGHHVGCDLRKREAYFDVLGALHQRERSLPEGEALVEIGKCIALVESMMPPAPDDAGRAALAAKEPQT